MILKVRTKHGSEGRTFRAIAARCAARVSVVGLIFVLSAAIALASSQEQPKKVSQDPSKTSYAALLERAKKNDTTVDFKELRLAYTETPEYSPYGGDRDARQKMFASLRAKEYEQALEPAEKILGKNFVELNAHFVAYVANRELARADKAAFHKFMFDGLMKSITGSGDGKTAETAFVVISTDEEYVLFNFLGLRPMGQSLINQNGHSYDRMTANDPKTNDPVVYFFNIDRPFNWLGHSLKK
ncbi:MAG TPA: DUF4919 domain-containing protein [Pyrinomonadaceae bacterium]|nr:DUF4919 domain-containing protein [Pyrinomonadaceae bacterium]